ncbi:alpha/beta hydrolase [Candidatus Protochlamydia phocaeensis]|uniref:alpha/beta hydrolase n=1 Tax=Candidatus Protochlamydia phocaeensis TaxID=1414722 RepID=UPI0008393A4A|nr:alpha/beta hydrolase [Candidatus Protochlamydia phocaeensis]
MSIQNNLQSIVRDYTSSAPSPTGVSSPILEKGRLGLNSLDKELTEKIETLMGHIGDTAKLEGVEAQKAQLRGQIKSELRELNKEISARIENKVKVIMQPTEKKEEQKALMKAKSMLEALDKRLDSVQLEGVAVSIFKEQSSFKGDMQKIFEKFVTSFVGKLMDKVRSQIYHGWTEVGVSKRAHYDKQLALFDSKEKKLEEKKEALQNGLSKNREYRKLSAENDRMQEEIDKISSRLLSGNLTPSETESLGKEFDLLFKEQTGVLEKRREMELAHAEKIKEPLQDIQKELDTIASKRVEIKSKIEGMEKGKQAGVKTRAQMQAIGGEPATIIDESTNSTLDGMYLSADKFRAKLKEAGGQIAVVRSNNFEAALNSQGNLLPDQIQTMKEALKGAQAAVVRYTRDKGEEGKEVLSGFKVQQGQVDALRESLDPLTSNGWVITDSDENGDVFIFQHKDLEALSRVDTVLNSDGNLAADQVQTIKAALEGTNAKLVKYVREGGTEALSGFKLPEDQIDSILGALDPLIQNGWIITAADERGDVFIFQQKDMDELDEWYKDENIHYALTTEDINYQFKEEPLTEKTSTGFGFPSSALKSPSAAKTLEEMGIAEAGFTKYQLGEKVYFFPQEDMQDYDKFAEQGIQLADSYEYKDIDLDKKSSGGTVILSSGNAGVYEMHKREMLAYLMRGMDVMGFNFAGYGESKGVPSGETFKKNMEAVYNHIQKHHPVPDEKLLCKALCMSGGPATYLAAKHPKMNLFLDQTYADFKEIVAEQTESTINGFVGNLEKKAEAIKTEEQAPIKAELLKIKKNLLQWAHSQVENLAHLAAKIIAPAWETSKEISKVEGKVGLLFTRNDSLMKLDKEIYNNYQAMTKAGKGHQVSIMGMEGFHGDSWVYAKGGGVVTIDADFIEAQLQQYESHYADYIKERGLNPFKGCVEEIIDRMGKISDLRDSEAVRGLISKMAEKWFPDYPDFGKENILAFFPFRDEVYTGRQQMDGFLKGSGLRGYIFV